jgi:hypothetical protein
VHHETAARELAKVEPGQRVGVVQTIVAEGNPVRQVEIAELMVGTKSYSKA